MRSARVGNASDPRDADEPVRQEPRDPHSRADLPGLRFIVRTGELAEFLQNPLPLVRVDEKERVGHDLHDPDPHREIREQSGDAELIRGIRRYPEELNQHRDSSVTPFQYFLHLSRLRTVTDANRPIPPIGDEFGDEPLLVAGHERIPAEKRQVGEQPVPRRHEIPFL